MTPDELRKFRKSLGLSAEAFARAVGLTGNDTGRTVRRWEAPEDEAGARRPSPMLATFAAACRHVPGFREWLIERGKG